ncbi:MAG: hypothetical protein ACYTGS_18575, partial [Planctomycetota bacterium]
MKSTIKKNVLAAIFVAIVVGVFWLAQKKLTNDVPLSALISVTVAIVLTYFYYRYVYEVPIEIETAPVKDATLEARELRAKYKRLEEKMKKLTGELSVAKLKLDAEIAERPLDQKELQQRLKHLNCLYGLSKIVNRQEITLEHIFQETVHLIRNA